MCSVSVVIFSQAFVIICVVWLVVHRPKSHGAEGY